MTAPFRELAGEMAEMRRDRGREQTDLGSVDYVVLHPSESTGPIPQASFAKKLRALARMEYYRANRLIEGPDSRFRHLQSK